MVVEVEEMIDDDDDNNGKSKVLLFEAMAP